MKKSSPIGFFDSGVGGLSVYSKFREVLPNEKTIYFGDLKNLPYGNKSQAELISFATTILDFFEQKNVKAVVIACNTSSALAYDSIKDNYRFKIFPIIQSCAKVISGMNIERVGVFATEGTVRAGAYKKEIQKYNPLMSVCEVACPNWVSIVEGVGNINKEVDVKNHLDKMLEFNPQKIVLGCTHYPYLLDELSKYVDKDLFIDPALIFVNYLKQNLLLNESSTVGTEEFYVSSAPELFVKNAKLFYKVPNMPTLV